MLFFCAVLFFQLSSFCNGFLLPENKTSVSSHGGNSLNDDHYVYLMGLLSTDRQNMAKMEQFVLQLQNDMNTMKQQSNGQNHNNNGSISNQEITDLKTESETLKQTIVKLQDGYSTLQKELNQVKSDNEALKQEMTQLKQDMKQVLDACTHSRSNNSTTIQQNIQELNNKTDKMSTQLNILTSTTLVRGQDFISLLQETNTAKKQISVLEKEIKPAKQQISTLETEAKQISSDLQKYKNHTTTKIDDVLHRMNQTVALTAGFGGGTISSYSIPNFSTIITAIGISDINGLKQSGKFTCEVAGVYLFTVFISSDSYDLAAFYMHKNSRALAFVYINHSSTSNRNTHTGTGVVAVSLNVGDTLYIKSFQSIHTYSNQNSMTIIKVG